MYELRTPAGWNELEAGDVAGFVRGEGGAHGYENRGAAAARVLVISEMTAPNVSIYPDTGQVGIFDASLPRDRRFGALFEIAAAISGYGGGEATIPKGLGVRELTGARSGSIVGSSSHAATRAAPRLSAIVCADWSSTPGNRAAWVALPHEWSVRQLMTPPITVSSLHRCALEVAGDGCVLLCVDAPIGVPRSYLAQAREVFGLGPSSSFLDLVERVQSEPAFFDPVTSPEAWSIRTPFFRVARGVGGRTRFEEAARANGVETRRAIEHATRGSSVFAFDLPGQVAPAAQALWRELIDARERGCLFEVWPFDGVLTECLHGQARVVVAEIYPRACYGAALAAALPAPPRSIAKTQRRVREAAIAELESCGWVSDARISLGDLALAVDNENEFDAAMSAAALLRLVVEGAQLDQSPPDPVSEGGMLGV